MAQEIKVTFVDGAVYDGFASTYTSPNGEVTWYFDADLDYRLQVDALGGTPSFQQYKTRSGGWVDISIIQNVEFKNISGTVSQLEPLTIYPSEGTPIVYDGSEAVSVSLAGGSSGISEERARELFVLRDGDSISGNYSITGTVMIYGSTGFTVMTGDNVSVNASGVGTCVSIAGMAISGQSYGSIIVNRGNSSSSLVGTGLTMNSGSTQRCFLGYDTSGGKLTINNSSGARVHELYCSSNYPVYKMFNTSGNAVLNLRHNELYYYDNSGNTCVHIGNSNGTGFLSATSNNSYSVTVYGTNISTNGNYAINSSGNLDITANGYLEGYAQSGYAMLKGSTSAVLEGYNGVVLSNTRSSDAADIFKFIEFTYDWYNRGSAYSKTLDEMYQVLYKRLSNVSVTTIVHDIEYKTADLPAINSFLLSWAAYIVGEVVTTNLGIAANVFNQTLLNAIQAVNNNPLAINKYVNSNMVVPMYNTLNQ